MSVPASFLDPRSTIEDIAKELDALSPAERLEALRATTRDQQRSLYTKAAASAPLSLDDFVPSDRPALASVTHHGRNTLPLLPSWRFFQKRFCKPDDGSERLFGYNESPTRGLVGPGFFVTIPTRGKPAWESRGAIVVDYFQVPDAKVVEGWPRVIPNTSGIQRFVYHGTRDFMRRVSRHVTIGAAFKGEKALDHYFTLCRED
jgi:hypothetical protein